MQTTMLSVSTIHNHGNLYVNHLRERKRVFIDRLGWDLPNVDGMEFDQYDTPYAKYIIQHEGERVIGGMRLVPTTAKIGYYTYMIKDAQDGKFADDKGGLPRDLLFDPAPVSGGIWECTQVFIAEGIPQNERKEIQFTMVQNMISISRQELGAKGLIAITHFAWFRWYPRRGIVASAIGPLLDLEGSKYQSIIIST